MGLVALQQTYENNSISISFGLLLLVWLNTNLGISGAILQWCISTLGILGRSKNCSTKWITTTMAPWIVPWKPMDGGEKGSYGGEASVFSPEDGEKNWHFPMGTGRMKWTRVFFCSLAKGQLSNLNWEEWEMQWGPLL